MVGIDLKLKVSKGEKYNCLLCRKDFEYKVAYMIDCETGVKRDVSTMLQLPICSECYTEEVNECLKEHSTKVRLALQKIRKEQLLSQSTKES